MPLRQPPMAHSPSPSGRQDPLPAHLADVAATAAHFASAFGAAEEARAAGLLHDLGKYGEIFARRLQGAIHRVDHSSAGAWAALTRLQKNGCAAALCIQGHHMGLQQASREALLALDPRRLREQHPQRFAVPVEDVEELLARFAADGLTLPEVHQSVYRWGSTTPADMLDVRMLFSALVDADYLETEAHFRAPSPVEKAYRTPGPPLQAERALAVLLEHLQRLAARTAASPAVTALRADLLDACLKAAESEVGLFTLTAPTGAGKTLSMLAFALRHALRHGLRRIVVVIPYLSIIEQTVREYRLALADLGDEEFLRRYVLESHSLAGTRPAGEVDSADGDAPNQERWLTENWDAPIIVTTSVQFLESLFANGPGPCRKLHRLAGSAVLFDEVQTLPVRLAVPTLGTLARLSARYGTSVVFATATQPAFDHLDPAVAEVNGEHWRPREIVSPALGLFERARRTEVQWPGTDERLSWEVLAARLADLPQVLCVVNLKRHALKLLQLLHNREGLLHLSTNMCPAHRQEVLGQVRDRLAEGNPCCLISTQCVEAGVDVDFPVVFRAWGPLDAIAQAAGRCNRAGRRVEGTVHVFFPDDPGPLYPDGTYRQAAAVAQALLQERGAAGMDIQDVSLFRRYYTLLYSMAAAGTVNREWREAALRQDFVEVNRLYRVISTDAINVLVPYDLAAYRALANEAREGGLTADWVARARPHAISLFRPGRDAGIRQWLQPVPLGRGRGEAQDWFIYLAEGHYDLLAGLQPPDSMECLIA